MCHMTTTGLGYHIWTLSDEEKKSYYRVRAQLASPDPKVQVADPKSQVFYVSIVFYYAGLGAVKMSILLQYLRVFAIKMRTVTVVTMAIIGMWSTALVFVSIFTCSPVEGFWDRSLNAKCIPNLPQWYINAAGNIVTDIVIFMLPIPVLWKLQLPKSQRLSLIAIFGLGTL
jgi:hypothetical protein